MNSTRKGTNASRRMLAPGKSGVQDELQDLRTTNPASTFLRAVVVRVLNDPTQIDADAEIELQSLVSNPEFVKKIPRNSIIARIVSSGQDRRGGTPVIAYPFLPSHISMPVKAGEQVWLLFENPQTGGSLPFWMWRVHEPSHVEDTNYTHSDRKFSADSTQSTIEKAEASNSDTVPSFPNGAGTANSYTLRGELDYEDIVENDPAIENFTPEPVPRFTKRPGDLAFQGSNNTLIVLGEDRAGAAQKEDDEKKEGAGAIDIVTGRGRFLPDAGSDPEETAPRVIENSRGNLETDKNPGANGNQDSETEGNVDFKRDSARLYMSMKSNVDEDFELSGNYPAKFDEAINDATDAATAVMKSDEVRIIARKDSEENINGSIRIIKEGEEGTDRIAILLLPNGTAQIDAEVIYIGRVGGNGPGKEGSEPYIKFSKYKEQMTTFISIVRDIYTAFSTQYAVPVAAPGTPHPGLTAAIPTLTQKIAELTELELSLDEAQSTRIFGE